MANGRLFENTSNHDEPDETNIFELCPDDDPIKKIAIAEFALSPNVRAAGTIEHLGTNVIPEPDGPDLCRALNAQIDKFRNGDSSNAESMLYSQSQTLDALFNHLCRHAISCVNNQGSFVDFEPFLRFGLKSQIQCQMTIKTLLEHQHFKTKNAPSKLLTDENHETLDTERKAAPINANSHLATVESIERANKRKR